MFALSVWHVGTQCVLRLRAYIACGVCSGLFMHSICICQCHSELSTTVTHLFIPLSHTLIQSILFQEEELDENKNLESLQSPPHLVFTLCFAHQ